MHHPDTPPRVGSPPWVMGSDEALQKPAANPYDTGRYPLNRKPLDAMNEPRGSQQPPAAHPGASLPQPSVEATYDLVEQAKAGDREALDRLLARFLPALRRWASGRLPRASRDLMDTDDLVQETAWRAVKRINQFESRHEGALQAYLRQAIMNRIRDEIRHRHRVPPPRELDENKSDHSASPLDVAIGEEAVQRYEAALSRLRPDEREAIVARVEMESSYQDIAQALGKPSADAARMAVSRALLRLAEEMKRGPA
jgi:RNA polymerase sigma factor (sigma-70 family)